MADVIDVFRRNFPDANPGWAAGGIDVSGWQPSTIIGDLCDAGHRFSWVTIKISEGDSYQSEEAVGQIGDALRLGIPWNAYHYLDFSGAAGEAANIAATLAQLPHLNPTALTPISVWLDCESDNAQPAIPDGYDAYINQVASRLEAAGRTVGIYTGAWWADGRLHDGRRPLWASDYDDGHPWPDYPGPRIPAAWDHAAIWQFTSRSPEFGALDLNVGPHNTTPPPAPPAPPLARMLHLADPWMDGDDVLWVQGSLAGRGHDPGPFDGVFGPQTDSAVRSFQAAVGLDVDGVVGPLTWAALQ